MNLRFSYSTSTVPGYGILQVGTKPLIKPMLAWCENIVIFNRNGTAWLKNMVLMTDITQTNVSLYS